MRGCLYVYVQILNHAVSTMHTLLVVSLHVHANLYACVHYHVYTQVVPSSWISSSVLVSDAAQLIKSTLHSNHRQEQNSSG